MNHTSSIAAIARRGAAALVFGLAAAGAGATVVSANSNDPLLFSWSYAGGGYDLAGTGSMNVTGFGSNTLSLAVSLTNATSAASSNYARLTSFGFGIDPNVSGISFVDANDGGMIGATLNAIPSLKTIEVCAFGGINCSGGSNGGIFANGGADAFTLNLFTSTNGGLWGSSVDIAPIGFKYQTNNGSFEFTATSSSSAGGQSAGSVPEPGSSGLALAGLALLGFGFRARRKA